MLMTTGLSARQKAAVIVRLMLADGAELNLSDLPPDAQARLAQDLATMDLLDRATRDAVIAEFCDRLDAVGLSFPGSMDGALDLLGAHLSRDTTNRLRRMAALAGTGDPWDRIAALPPAQLADLARTEAVEIAAVMFARLPVGRAADVFGLLDPALARQIAFAMSLTGAIEAGPLRRIGLALMRAVDALPSPAIEDAPVEKIGAILNFSPANTRDTVLAGLDEDDAVLAGQVRRAIFTWANIPHRIDRRDIPRIVREVEGLTLTKAMAGSSGDDRGHGGLPAGRAVVAAGGIPARGSRRGWARDRKGCRRGDERGHRNHPEDGGGRRHLPACRGRRRRRGHPHLDGTGRGAATGRVMTRSEQRQLIARARGRGKAAGIKDGTVSREPQTLARQPKALVHQIRLNPFALHARPEAGIVVASAAHGLDARHDMGGLAGMMAFQPVAKQGRYLVRQPDRDHAGGHRAGVACGGKDLIRSRRRSARG